MSEYPSVSVVIVNLNGKSHLKECFDSIKALDYPADKVEVVLVDNGSTDGSREYIKSDYGWVKLITNDKNEGFAKPSNDGARAAAGEYVAFLNNDMKVKRSWLKELLASIRRSGAKCAGSVITNWNGELLDFAGGGVNFQGLGFQDDFARPMKEMEPKLKEDRELLFACGGAMIVERRLFLDAGGFDEDYFAYYEDVDLGWRLRVLGCKIVLSVKSRVWHKHNSTSRSMPRERIQYLFERNKMYTCYKNYGEEMLYRVFFPSLLLDMRETYDESGIDGYNYNIKNSGAFDPEPVRINHRAAMKLAAMNEFTENLRAFTKKRDFIQSHRGADDGEIMRLFTAPFIVFPKDTAALLSDEYNIVNLLGMDKLFGTEYKCRILAVTGGASAGRTESAAKAAAVSGVQVSFACPEGEAAPEGAIRFSLDDDGALLQAAKEAFIIIAPAQLLAGSRSLSEAAMSKFVVADVSGMLTDPAADGEKDGGLGFILRLGDMFICADDDEAEKLKDMLTKLGRLTPSFEEKYGGAGRLIAVIPGGADMPEKARAQIASFCAEPMHSFPRGLAEDSQPESFRPAAEIPTAEEMPELVARIADRQEELRRLILRDSRRIGMLGEDSHDMLEWSRLMERRFKKLKSKAAGNKLLRKFIH